MVLRIAITDSGWVDFLSERAREGAIEDVNFWQPSSREFRALGIGEPLLFKRHAPQNDIVGCGFFLRYARMSIAWAWEAFGPSNGVADVAKLLTRVGHYRRKHGLPAPRLNDDIGCIVLSEVSFFSDPIPVPSAFAPNIVQGKNYDSGFGDGRLLWEELQTRLQASRFAVFGRSTAQALSTPRYGAPSPVRPRLGQGGFRFWVTEAYNRRCAMSGERTLPVLEAAHIQPYSSGGTHDPGNGMLLRSDLHRLFDLGYLAVEPKNLSILVSDRIRAEFKNGRNYYELRGRQIALPNDPDSRPVPARLEHHLNHVYRD